MKTLNIFTVEKFIFLNPKAKRVLWKEFPEYFKEYIFLKQAGVDTALLNKLYMKFLEKFSKKNTSKYLDEIFKPWQVNFNYNFKQSLININFKLIKVKDVSGKFNKVNLKDSSFKLINLTENSPDIHENSRQYPNIFCTRNKNEIKVTLWR